ncbi:MAG: hypothetical protein ACTSV7_00300 [Candidatus Baldrarchaeia archaeon]
MKFIRNLLRGRETKKETKELPEENVGVTDLEKLCLDSPDVFKALKDTMFLDPRKIDVSLEEASSRAKKLEKAKDTVRAAVWYRIAGGLAIYSGDVSKVKEYFSKYAKLTGRNVKILEVPEEAVNKAREYYKKYLKEER